jgi:flagellar hook-basal body complex protein FliE
VITPPPATDTPTPTVSPTDTSGITGSNSVGVVHLSARSPVQEEEYQRYTQGQRDFFNDFLMTLDQLEEAQAIARKEASKYANGKNNDLAQATQDVKDYSSHVKSSALQLAMDFGYSTSQFMWTYWYDKDPNFNEVKVDFR